MSNEPHKQAFEDAIRADPYDDVTRQVFADWLEEHGYDDEAVLQRSWTPQKQQAEDWLVEYAREHNLAYADLIGAANHFLDTGDTNHLGVEVTAVLFDPNRWEEFWHRFSLVTGRNSEGATGDPGWRAYTRDHPGYEDPCSMCPGEGEGHDDRGDPYGDDFYTERGW